jgi:hypothetical protein
MEFSEQREHSQNYKKLRNKGSLLKGGDAKRILRILNGFRGRKNILFPQGNNKPSDGGKTLL